MELIFSILSFNETFITYSNIGDTYHATKAHTEISWCGGGPRTQ